LLKRICFDTIPGENDGDEPTLVLKKNLEGTKVSHFIKTGLVWLKNPELNLKCAGLYSLTLIWRQIGALGKKELLDTTILDILQAETDEISSDVDDFYAQLKENREVKEKLAENPWSSVLADDQEEFTTIASLKRKEPLVQLALDFLIEFIENGYDSLELQKRAISILLQLKKHPHDEILMQLLLLLKNLFCGPEESSDTDSEIKFQQRLSTGIVSSLSKDFLMFIFAIVKKKFMTNEICGEALSKCLNGFLRTFSGNQKFMLKLLEMVCIGLKSIIQKCVAKVDRNVPVIEKILTIIDGIFEDQDLICGSRKVCKDQDDAWVSVLNCFFLKSLACVWDAREIEGKWTGEGYRLDGEQN
jgi:hypothetical protein